MGRNVKPRISYEQDATYMGRLAKAVELDDTFSANSKKELIARLNFIHSEFLAHASKQLREASSAKISK